MGQLAGVRICSTLGLSWHQEGAIPIFYIYLRRAAGVLDTDCGQDCGINLGLSHSETT